MIHLDHSHSSSITSPAKPPNLILSANSQHNLPWSSPARDPRQFYHDSQDHFLSDPVDKPSSRTLSPTSGPVTPADAQDPALPQPSPSSPPDPRSPPADSTSSLTPPPDAATPNNAMDPPDEPPGLSTKTSTMDGQTRQQVADEMDRASRQSTPLSELSSAPETAPDDEADSRDDPSNTAHSAPHPADGHHNRGDANSSSGAAKESSHVLAAPTSSKDGGPRSLQHQKPLTFLRSSPSSLHNFADHVPFATTTDPHAISSDGPLTAKIVPGHHVGQSFLSDNISPHHTLGPQSKMPALDPKVVSILELNSLLLRVCMEYQGRGAMTDPHFTQYSSRLQSNLTWLAAAADENHKVSQSTMALPIMQSPPVVEFPEMERILQLYRDLPNIFSKEIQRRQQGPGGIVNGNAKRERTEEPSQDGIHKRRDTGETKAHNSFTPSGPGPSTPHPPSIQVPNAPPNMNMAGGPVPRMGSPSMPPPPVPPGAISPNDAHILARRQAQMQMRAMQQQHAETNRQMSPPSGMSSGMSMSNMPNAGPSSMSSMQLTPSQLAQLSSIGPQAVQHFQILQQNPHHPIVQLMAQQIPGFMQLPLQDKLQKMQAAQNMMQARQQQRAAAQAQGVQGASSMSGFPQGGMQGGISLQHSGDGSPPRMSPVSQSPMQSSFSQGNNSTGDPRSIPLHQRQLLLIQQQQQQQQMMRASGGGGGGVNLHMLNQQQMMQDRMRFEQQRMAQAQAQASGQGSSGVMGSPMVDGPQFPALRSNPGIPGIARSGRTPSDTVPSPVLQQRLGMSGQPSEEQQRAMMMQQAQQRGMTTPQMQQGGGFGNGGMSNPAYVAQMQQQMAMSGQNAFRMASPPTSVGGMGGGSGGFGPGSVPSPVGGNPGQMWGQNPGAGGQGFTGGGPFMVPSPSASQHDGSQTNVTPGSHQQMGGSLPGDQGLESLDFFNWG